eukprot:350941-Chlamydomonas_euryale.AAC.16
MNERAGDAGALRPQVPVWKRHFTLKRQGTGRRSLCTPAGLLTLVVTAPPRSVRATHRCGTPAPLLASPHPPFSCTFNSSAAFPFRSAPSSEFLANSCACIEPISAWSWSYSRRKKSYRLASSADTRCCSSASSMSRPRMTGSIKTSSCGRAHAHGGAKSLATKRRVLVDERSKLPCLDGWTDLWNAAGTATERPPACYV